MAEPSVGSRPLRIGLNAHLQSREAGYRQAGVSRYIAELVRHLAAEPGPHAYTLFTPPHGTGELALPARVRVAASRLPTQRPPVRIVWEQALGPVAAARRRLDVFHSPVNVAPLTLPCRSVITIHDLAFLAYPERFRAGRRRYLALLTRLSARRATRVIAVSQFTADEVVARLGVPPGRVVVVPNGVGEEYQSEPDPRRLSEFRRSNDVSDQYVLFLGTIEPRKNVPGLIEAFAQVAAEFPAIDLVIAGGRGWLADDVYALPARLDLARRVRFTGYVPAADLPRWYQAATVAVYPSLYEGFGFPPLEAMACGTPVITSDRAAMPEVVGDAGVLVDPTDVAALAAALRALLRDPDRRVHLSTAGRARAATFTWARAARATRAVYEAASGSVTGCRTAG
ncbi:MAG: glycosyltransferase family 4 protein [Chloroflexi bacterium]|nr:glycosyltransferase family 4 protein [Chloroflexota bacterium]